MDKIFNAGDTELTESLFNDGVIGNGDSLAVNLSETSLVDKLGNGVSGGITILLFNYKSLILNHSFIHSFLVI